MADGGFAPGIARMMRKGRYADAYRPVRLSCVRKGAYGAAFRAAGSAGASRGMASVASWGRAVRRGAGMSPNGRCEVRGMVRRGNSGKERTRSTVPEMRRIPRTVPLRRQQDGKDARAPVADRAASAGRGRGSMAGKWKRSGRMKKGQPGGCPLCEGRAWRNALDICGSRLGSQLIHSLTLRQKMSDGKPPSCCPGTKKRG